MDEALGIEATGLLKDADGTIEDVGMDGVRCDVIAEEEGRDEEGIVGDEDFSVDDANGGFADAAADVVEGLIDLNGNVDDPVVVFKVCIEVLNWRQL